MKITLATALSGVLCISMLAASPAQAMDDSAVLAQLKAMQAQISSLQSQVGTLEGELKKAKKESHAASAAASSAKAEAKSAQVAVKALPAASATTTVASAAKPEAPAASGLQIMNKNNIRLTLGGFIEAAVISRSRNETADIGSDFSTGMPFPISPNYHMSEFRGTARQSRLSLLAQGTVDPDTELAAFFEGDFNGAAPTANSRESNSYNPRIRHIYASVDRSDIGTHVLAGQAWSLITLNKKGIVARQENIPMDIDAQYVPGFNWTRNPQLRMVQDLYKDQVTAGLSLESPQAVIFNGPNNPSGSPTFNNGGGSLNASTSTYSTDLAPDMIAKLAFDPGFGHYEISGIGRFFRDRNHTHNSTIMGGGVGAGTILPLIAKKLDFQLSGLFGTGIGRYGSSQLPDVTLKPDGGLATVNSFDLLAGLIGHPTEQWDLYVYGGTERAQKKDFTSAGLGYGYGSPLYNNTGCNTEGAALTTCVANTSAVSQITAGTWWKFYKGTFGTMQAGLQDSFTRRDTFVGQGASPSTNENITMLSLRYYPF